MLPLPHRAGNPRTGYIPLRRAARGCGRARTQDPMLLTLSATSLRSLLSKGKSGKPKMDLMELPEYARQVLGLHGVTLTTELLAGASRARMEQLRERADKAAAAILLLFEAEPQAMGAAD